MQRRSVRHWSERGWKKPRNTLGSFSCFFQAFAAQLITEIHSSYLTDSGTFQELLRPEIKPVTGCKDFLEEIEHLTRIDELLLKTGMEDFFLQKCAEDYAVKHPGASEATLARHAANSRQAMRCMVLKNLLGESYRTMSILLAHSPFYRKFCWIEDFLQTRVPGKSTLQNYAEWLPAEVLCEVMKKLQECLADQDKALELGLEKELDLSAVWVDSTCLKANIHFPCDWVLLRDGIRTLVKSIALIRKNGLKHRMGDPYGFLKKANGLSMEMSAMGRKKKTGKKGCKRVQKGFARDEEALEDGGEACGKIP